MQFSQDSFYRLLSICNKFSLFLLTFENSWEIDKKIFDIVYDSQSTMALHTFFNAFLLHQKVMISYNEICNSFFIASLRI